MSKKKRLVVGEWYYRCGYRSSNNSPTTPRIIIETVEFFGIVKRDPRSSTAYYTFDYVNPEAHDSRGFQIASREQAEQSVLTLSELLERLEYMESTVTKEARTRKEIPAKARRRSKGKKREVD
jgi:hypothetical protein